jgi:hypothetical protein
VIGLEFGGRRVHGHAADRVLGRDFDQIGATAGHRRFVSSLKLTLLSKLPRLYSDEVAALYWIHPAASWSHLSFNPKTLNLKEGYLDDLS